MKKDQRVYLRDIVERIERIQRFTIEGREAFLNSVIVQDAVLRNFQVMGEAVKRMDDEFRTQHADIEWRRIAGFRDVLVHDYDKLILNDIWDIIENHLPLLKPKIDALLRELEKQHK